MTKEEIIESTSTSIRLLIRLEYDNANISAELANDINSIIEKCYNNAHTNGEIAARLSFRNINP